MISFKNSTLPIENEEEIDDSPIVNLLESLLVEALSADISDIHIELSSKETAIIKYRKDNMLSENLQITSCFFKSLARRIKVLARLECTEIRKPQDGRFSYDAAGFKADIRVSCIPTIYGDSIVLRLLKLGKIPPSLTDLGFSSSQLNKLQMATEQRSKLVLICGPTGSGKTTTLAAILNSMTGAGMKIVTIRSE